MKIIPSPPRGGKGKGEEMYFHGKKLKKSLSFLTGQGWERVG